MSRIGSAPGDRACRGTTLRGSLTTRGTRARVDRGVSEPKANLYANDQKEAREKTHQWLPAARPASSRDSSPRDSSSSGSTGSSGRALKFLRVYAHRKTTRHSNRSEATLFLHVYQHSLAPRFSRHGAVVERSKSFSFCDKVADAATVYGPQTVDSSTSNSKYEVTSGAA